MASTTQPPIQRVSPLTVYEWQRPLALSTGPGITRPDGTVVRLGTQELVTTSDEGRMWRGDGTYLGGTIDHGAVGDATAMAAIWLQPSCTRGVHPGDTCWRSDLGVECRVVSGHNATAVWRAVTSGGGGGSAQWGEIGGTLGDQGDLADVLSTLATGLEGKQAGAPSLTALSAVEPSAPGLGLLTLPAPSALSVPAIAEDGGVSSVPIASLGGSGGGYLGDFTTIAGVLSAGAAPGQTASVLAAGKMYLCVATPSNVRSAWVFWTVASANLGRYWRWSIGYIPGGYLEVVEVRYRCAGTWYPTAPMTSANQPAPLVCSQSSYYSAGYEGWHAFDGSGSIWHTASASSAWLTIDMGAANSLVPDAIGITLVRSDSSRRAQDFSVAVSQSGTFSGEETVLFSTTGETAWSPNTERVFEWLP